jgi:hypothetical protein
VAIGHSGVIGFAFPLDDLEGSCGANVKAGSHAVAIDLFQENGPIFLV